MREVPLQKLRSGRKGSLNYDGRMYDVNRKSSSLNIIQVRPSRKWQTGRGREARGREKRERIKLLGVACNEDIPRSYFSRIIIYHEVNFGRDVNASFSLPSPLFLFAETLTL